MRVVESKRAQKDLEKLRSRMATLLNYKLQKDRVEQIGPDSLRKIGGYHDELIKGGDGLRSSRLGKGYRVFYRLLVDEQIEVCEVAAINNHDYKKVTRS